MKWTLCIATVPIRAEKLKRMMDLLLPQVEKYKDIEILIFYNNFEHTIGYLRQKMQDEARGEYISSLDDDDLIPKDFVDTIYPLLDGVDYVGFEVELKNDGKTLPRVYHSLKYSEWSQDDDGYYRGVTHLNPIKTEIARRATYPEVENGEDYQWTVAVHDYMKGAGREFTEHYIDRRMYTYDHFGHEPMAQLRRKPVWPKYKSKNVRFHPESTPNA